MNIIEQEIKKFKLEDKIKKLLFIKNTKKHSIEWGMNYITFSPSKRIRPLLLLEANQIYSKADADAYLLGAAVELIHTYSLVHDDLPCMDDDDLRRGVKTLHTIKDEAYALLVGDALLTRAFGLLAGYSKIKLLPEIIKLFYEKAGTKGMIQGQYLDLEGENKNLKVEDINNINRFKTGGLFELSLMLGGINSGASSMDIKNLERLGTITGLVFQLQDDILDIIGDEKVLGKNINSDEKNKKSSIPLVLGIGKAKILLLDYKKQAYNQIDKMNANKEFFYKLFDYFVDRKK